MEIVQQEEPAPEPPVLGKTGKSKEAKCIACGQDVDLADAKSCMRDLCTLGSSCMRTASRPAWRQAVSTFSAASGTSRSTRKKITREHVGFY